MRNPSGEIELVLQPSPCWLLVILCGAILAILASLQLEWFFLRLLFIVLLPSYLLYLLCRYHWKILSCSVLAFRYQSGRWWIRQHGDNWSAVSIDEAPLVTAFFTSICFRKSVWRKIHVVVFADGVDPVAYRKLRVLLRMRPSDPGHEMI